MSHTFDSVVEFFGSDAQIVGGDIIVNVDGKNVEVGKTRPTDGVFSVTADGLLLLEGAPVVKQQKSRKSKAQTADLVVENAEEILAEATEAVDATE